MYAVDAVSVESRILVVYSVKFSKNTVQQVIQHFAYLLESREFFISLAAAYCVS